MRHLPIVLSGLLAAILAACGVDAETNTGLRLVVTLDESLPPEAIPADLDTLRFYVATQADGQGDIWVLNEALSGRPVDITGRDLSSDPYKLFVGSRATPPETVRVVVVAQSGGVALLGGTLTNPATQTLQAGKILERTIVLHKAEAMPRVTWTDTGCLLSEDGRIAFGSVEDQDCDGYIGAPQGGDCNDHDPTIHPGADDQHDCDGVDNNCDGVADPGGHDDFDQDGVTPCDGDCDDRDPNVYTGAQEACDGVDNNCNGKCDEGDAFDKDGDGYTICGTHLLNGGETCEPAPYPDCDDQDAAVFPGAEESCDGVDNNCNGKCDEGTDEDGDGFNPCGSQNGPVPIVSPESGTCPQPRSEWQDCAEGDPNIHPQAPELCDGLDNDCDGNSHPGATACYAINQNTGACVAGQAPCDESQGAWSECVLATGNPPPPEALVRCRAWDECSDHPDPALCMSQLLSSLPLSCVVHMRHPGVAPCADDPPLYALPFGTANMTDCTWTLQLPAVQPGWYAVGLVDPSDPSTVSDSVQSCQAYLLARPYSQNDTPAETLSGFLNLEAHDANGLLLLEVPVTISSDLPDGCGSLAESMECQ